MRPFGHTKTSQHSLQIHQPKRTTTGDSNTELSFVSDRKGDTDNLRYGSLDQYKIPRYRNAGFGRLIGLDRHYRATSPSGPTREIDNESLDSARRQQKKSLLDSIFTADEEDSVASSSTLVDNSFVAQADYINLTAVASHANENQHGLVQNPVTNKGHDSLPEDPSFSVIARQHEPHPVSNGPLEDQAFEQYRNKPIVRRNNELLRLVEVHPRDVTAWLDLIHHQEQFLSVSSLQDSEVVSPTSQQVIAEMRASLYEKALAAVDDRADRVRLTKGLIKEGSRIWDTDRQLKEWQAILRQTPSLSLWLEFLSFQQQSALVFSVENCLKLYPQLFTQAKMSENPDRNVTDLILRLTIFLYQAGYEERSIALWQAVLEINFFRSSTVQESDIKPVFAQFWESEAARLGEEHAKGWTQTDYEAADSKVDEVRSDIGEAGLWRDWATEEQRLSHIQVMPARSVDQVNEDDPYRVVLFYDIEDFVYEFQEAEHRDMLIRALLAFCGLPPMQARQLEHQSQKTASYFPARGVDRQSVAHPKFVLTDSFALTAPLDSHFACFSRSAVSTSPLLEFALRVLTELADRDTASDYMVEYLIALNSVIEPASAKKLARSLLKKRPDRPRLYNIYGLVQARTGKMTEAEKIWSTAISMTSSFDHTLQIQAIFLWESWIWELLHQRQSEKATTLLVTALPRGTQDLRNLSAVTTIGSFAEKDVLKARHYLSSHITSMLQQTETDSIIAYTNLLAILNYLVSNHGLDEALRTYESTLTSLNNYSDPLIVERMHQSRARLIDLHVHSTSRGYRPVQIATALKQSRDLFPDNSIFHNLHETYSRRAGLIDRLRSINDPASHGPEENSTQIVKRGILRLATELDRPLYAGSTPHTIRAAFTSLTSVDHEARHIAGIWTAWINWELDQILPTSISKSEQSRLPPSASTSASTSASALTTGMPPAVSPQIPPKTAKRLKDILLSGIRACPGVKEVYMQAFVHPIMRRIMGEDGLEEIYKSMLDRGLRIRVDIEDQIEQRKQRE